MRLVKQFECLVQNQDIQLFCTLEIGIPRNRLEEVLYKMKELRGVEMGKLS